MKEKKILVIGSSNTDMVLKTPHLPLPGETIIGGEFTMGPGGKGANQAVAASRLGGDVTFVCKVGKDMFGDNSLKHYVEEGIDVSHALRSDKPSGVALINVDEKGENCIAVASGANGDVTEADIESLKGIIKESSILIMQLEMPVECVLKAARIAHEAGVFVLLNPAPYRPLPEEIYQYISLITPNQTESGFMTGVEVHDEKTAAEAAAKLRGKGVKDILMTMGSKGSMGFTSEGSFFTPSYKVVAADTTGAGDTFCGALAVALTEGLSLPQAASFATGASAIAIQKMGAQEAMPTRAELEDFIKNN